MSRRAQSRRLITMKTTPRLYGLVLSGGKSTRMGTDKGEIVYHQLPQREHIYKLLEKCCEHVYQSLGSSQLDSLPSECSIIFDEDEFKGPYNGIMSAHNKYPEVSWLVIACDLPLINEKVLNQLVSSRDTAKAATVFATKKSKLPEPLVAIWEAKGLQEAKKQLEENPSGPRKFLMHSDVKLVYPENDEVLFNANSKEEYEDALSKLKTN